MSQYPGNVGEGGYPLNYNTGAYTPGAKPASVTVICIFAIILGSLGLLCGGFGLVTQLLMLASGGRNPFMPSLPMMTDSAVIVYGVITGIVNILIAAALLAAGIGGLKLMPLARRAMVKLSIFILVWATAMTIVQITWIGPRTIALSQRMQARMGAPANPALVGNFQTVAQAIGALIGWVLWCALPVCVLIFWRSPRVVAAFEGPAGQPPSGQMWPPPPGGPSPY
jgi:hypothetical protein